MTITATNLTNNVITASPGSSQTTASISPAANALIIVSVANNIAAANTPTVTGASGTWVQIATSVDATNARRVTMFRDLSSAPGSGALTIDFAAQTQTNIGWSIEQFTGVDTSGTHGSGAIVQSVTGTTNATNTGTNVTLAALKSNQNAAYGYIRSNGTQTIVKGSNFTELSYLTGVKIESEWALNQTVVDWTWVSEAQVSAQIAIEIAAAPTAVFMPNIQWPARQDYKYLIAGEAKSADAFAYAQAHPPTPKTFFFPRIEELPGRQDYRVTLAATTQPVRDYSFVQAITPSSGFDAFVTDDRPVRADIIGVSLRATTAPIWPRAPPPPTQTPNFQFELSIQEDNPRRPDYSRALASTSATVWAPYVPPIPPTTTPGIYSNLVVQEDLPRRRDYTRALAPQPVGPKLPWDVAAMALFAQMSVQPSDTRKTLYNNLIVSLINAGIWQKFDVFYVQAVETTQQSNLNWISPSNNVCTDVGTPTFTADRGISNGVYQTTCRDCHFTPSTQGVKFLQNDASMFCWSLTNSRSSGEYFWGQPSGAIALALNPWNAVVDQNTASVSINDAGGSHPLPPTKTDDFFLANRNNSANYDFYQATTNLGNVVKASTGVPAVSMLLGATLRTMAAGGLGGSLTSQNITDLYNALFAYLAAVNAIIAPTPSTYANLSIQEDLPRRPDYRQTLNATTSPSNALFVPPPEGTPNTYFNLTVQEELPRRLDYRPVLESTTHPVRDLSFVQAITPFTWFNESRLDDRPIVRDYSRTLSSTTSPVLSPQAPPPAQTPNFYFQALTPDPIRPDYRTVLESTTRPVRDYSFVQAITPSIWSDEFVTDWRPVSRDYSRTLESTTHPVLSPQAPPPAQTPNFQFNLSLSDDRPIRADYRQALVSTSRPIGPALLPTATPTTWFEEVLSDDRPGRADYSRVVESTTHSILPPQAPPPAPTPSTLFDLSLQEDLPRRRDYGVVLSSTTSPVVGLIPPVLPPTCAKWGIARWGVDLWCGQGLPLGFPIVSWEMPRRLDYSRAVTSTTTRHALLPPVLIIAQTTSNIPNLSIQEDLPRRPDYRRTLTATTTPRDPIFIQAPIVAPPSSGILQPPIELPRRRDYWSALQGTSNPVWTTDLCANLVLNPGFETGALAPFWNPISDDVNTSFGVDSAPAHAHSGNDSAFIANSPSTTATLCRLEQTVTVAPNTNYTLTGWVASNNTGTTGIFGAKNADSSYTCGVTPFHNLNVGGNPVYEKFRVEVNSGPNSSLIIFASYVPPSGVTSSINLDDVRLVPDACDPWLPSVMANLALADDRPGRPDYRTVLGSTTRPIGPQLLPTPVPPGPRANLIIREDLPRRLDYRLALLSNWGAAPSILPPAITPIEFDLAVGDDQPARPKSYNTALLSTLYMVGPPLIPTSTPDIRADVITPTPQARDYRGTLESTTHAVGQFIGSFAVVATPGFGWNVPFPPLPGRVDYSRVLESTTESVLPFQFVTATTPATSFFGPDYPQYIQRTFWTVIAATSGFTAPYLLPPIPPLPPVSCIVTFMPRGSEAVVALLSNLTMDSVTLVGGTAGTVTLVPATIVGPVTLNSASSTIVVLPKNPNCP